MKIAPKACSFRPTPASVRRADRRPASNYPLLSLAAVLLGVATPSTAVGPFLTDPFPVNTITFNSQAIPAVASNPAGASIVAWQCIRQGAAGFDICAQRYNSAGVASGPELLVNVVTAGNQQSADVAIDDEGVATIVWESFAHDGDGWGIYGRRFGNDGAPLGGEFRVNQQTADDQRNPSVDAAPDGRMVVTWDSDGQDGSFDGVFARRYRADGSAMGGEFQVNTTVFGQQFHPDVALSDNAGFVVVWACLGQGGGTDVCAQRIAWNGNFLGNEFVVNSTLGNSQSAPSVDVNGAGAFVVAWESFGQDGDGQGVYAQAFRADGTPRGGETQINSTTAGLQRQASVAVNGDASYVVTWSSTDQLPGSTSTIVARCFGPGGAPRSPELILHERGTFPAVAVDRDGDAFAVWQAPGPEIFGRRLLSTSNADCVETDSAMCLRDDRFKVEVAWRKPDGETGSGMGSELTADTSYFWFFRPSNVEMVIKVLDACSQDRFWVFAGGLTNVEVDVRVTDTANGTQRLYQNSLGETFQPIQDTDAFATCPANSPLVTDAGGDPAAIGEEMVRRLEALRSNVAMASGEPSPRGGNCQPGPNRLCLRDRFAVEVDWRKPNGIEGVGTAVPITSDTGYFWFFRASNVEMVIKVLDGCNGTGHYWVFAGGLTNVRAVIRVRDTMTNTTKTYINPQSTTFEPIQDNMALATCP